ncbi:MAG TPA: carboxymuconolactone decarboxylase family protein [Chloroflexota bacterium]|jgi:alkylhydroperoxidase family enzyme|nr:carboxymuconolactone decarboxylase family protein [Chloroflexota bacterium]
MRIQPVEKGQAAEAARAVYDEIEQGGGRVSNFWRMLAHKPPVLRAFRSLYQAVWAPGALEPRLKELAYLRTSILNGCAY